MLIKCLITYQNNFDITWSTMIRYETTKKRFRDKWNCVETEGFGRYPGKEKRSATQYYTLVNKANLRDLIAATGLVIVPNWIQIVKFSAHLTLQLDGWPQTR